MRFLGWSPTDVGFVGAMLAASIAQPFIAPGNTITPAPYPVLEGGTRATNQRPCGAWSTHPLPSPSRYFAHGTPAWVTCATVTGYVCTVNFQTTCNRRGPEPVDGPRLSTLQQLYLLQHCAVGPPGAGGGISGACLRVRWVG